MIPRVSVVIPVHDAARTLARSIESVLAQDAGVPLELLVVDDASTDGSAAIATRFTSVPDVDVRVLRVEGASARGPAHARNLGIGAARAELLAFNDADDAWAPDKLGRQLAILDARPELEFTLCAFENVADEGFTLPDWAIRERPGEAMPGFVFQAMLARRRVFDRIGLLDEAMRRAEDTDWFLRARDAGVPMWRTQDVGVRRYIHDRNLTGDVREAQRALVRAVRASVVRRRARGEPIA